MAVRPRRTLHFQLTIPAALSLLGLGAFCLAVTFYLGLVTGKSLRVPEAPLAQAPPSVGGESRQKPLTEEELSFYNLGEQKSNDLNLNLKTLNELREKTNTLAAEESTPATTPQTPQTPQLPTTSVVTPCITFSGRCSRTSRSAWLCTSMKPGAITNPAQSTTSISGDASISPTESIC